MSTEHIAPNTSQVAHAREPELLAKRASQQQRNSNRCTHFDRHSSQTASWRNLLRRRDAHEGETKTSAMRHSATDVVPDPMDEVMHNFEHEVAQRFGLDFQANNSAAAQLLRKVGAKTVPHGRISRRSGRESYRSQPVSDSLRESSSHHASPFESTDRPSSCHGDRTSSSGSIPHFLSNSWASAFVSNATRQKSLPRRSKTNPTPVKI
mmetsp:Transcript_64835/g.128177  ORF Transcript_64835/g.128177 Transcript_64835/m.128177 type:complete len:208 (+) Transcript_64835:67-690(+)